jgi:hypothetical protein
MSSSQALILGVTILVIMACSGCVGGGGNSQTFDTIQGQIQIKTPETLEPTAVGSVYAGGVLSLGKKDKGSPLITITLTKNNAYSNFQSAVSMAKLMPLLDERDLTTNDNHKMHWSTVNVAGFKQYEGIIDYVDDKGLVVSIKGLSDTADLMTGEKIPGFSENEYLDIFKSFTFLKSDSESQSKESTALDQSGISDGDIKPKIAFIANSPKSALYQGHVAFGYQRDDGKFVFGSFGPSIGWDLSEWNIDTPLAPAEAPGLLTSKVFDSWSEVKQHLSENGYSTFKKFQVEDSKPQAAWDTMTELKDRNYDVFASTTQALGAQTENCLTFAKKVLTAYGVNGLPDIDEPTTVPSAFSAPNAYYMAIPGDISYPDSLDDSSVSATHEVADPGLPSDTASVTEPASDTSNPSENDDTPDENTKTAYTHDGISYISKERVEENIKAGVAKPGDYEEVQVPLDTFVVGGSTIPSET